LHANKRHPDEKTLTRLECKGSGSEKKKIKIETLRRVRE
jgi:hypothetical protein